MPIVLFVRLITVAIPLSILGLFKKQAKNIIYILSWGGLRGGLAIALALSLPDSADRDLLLTITYAVVVFSVLIQGSTVKYLLPKNN